MQAIRGKNNPTSENTAANRDVPVGLLTLGIWAGPIYVVVGAAQAMLREGFDPRRHALSLLATAAWDGFRLPTSW
ncbi:MAG TPA: hypothetical protein VIB39_06370 [Candidatus Angelobacter sp.]|jgi:hypothetical protein